MNDLPNKSQIERFLRDHIDSVPQLEALLLIWRQNPRLWTSQEMARELYVSADMASNVLSALHERNLIARAGSDPTAYALVLETEERKQLLEGLGLMYRNELIRVSNMIHANASPGLRDFARAFRFKKE